jgi:hypothetical protein
MKPNSLKNVIEVILSSLVKGKPHKIYQLKTFLGSVIESVNVPLIKIPNVECFNDLRIKSKISSNVPFVFEYKKFRPLCFTTNCDETTYLTKINLIREKLINKFDGVCAVKTKDKILKSLQKDLYPNKENLKL